jgi:aryl-alcohol dehydrogenase-like predicted oxidoreductase
MLTQRLVLGCARLTGGASATAAEALVRAALDAGITGVDTAPSYGMGTAEAVVGRALRQFGGPVSVTAKLGSARDPHAMAKSWLRLAKRALAPVSASVWDHHQPPATRIARPSGHDFRRSAMQASLHLSRDRLGWVDHLLLHDVSAGEVNTRLLADLAELAASVSAAPGYASQAQWDADLDARFPQNMVAQCAMTPTWLAGAGPADQRPQFLHSVVKAGAALRTTNANFAQKLEQAARIVGTGNADADRIAALYAAATMAVPSARLVIASTHPQRLLAVLRAIARIDAAGTTLEIAAILV